MLSCQKDQFGLDRRAHYLNGAAYSPQLKSALKKSTDAIRLKTRHPYLINSGYHFETANRVREGFSDMLKAGNAQRIAIVPAVSYALATVAHNLHRLPGIAQKSNIVMVQDEFPDSYYAFQRVGENLGLRIRQIPYDRNAADFARQWNDDLLAAITQDTALVVVQHVHWMYGVKFDLGAIGRKCRESGALFVVDGSQSIGVLPFDIREFRPDVLVTATYKWMLGIYGVALAYFGPFFDDGIPLEENWINRGNSGDFTKLTQYTNDYQPLAQRYNTGEFSQFFQLPILADAIERINSWGVEALQQYSAQLVQTVLSTLKAEGCSFAEAAYSAAHLTGIRLPAQINLEKLLAQLKKNQVFVSVRGDIVRLSVHIYNDMNDLSKFCDCILASKSIN